MLSEANLEKVKESIVVKRRVSVEEQSEISGWSLVTGHYPTIYFRK